MFVNTQKRSDQNGFTLVEVMISMSLMSAVIAVALMGFVTVQRTWRVVDNEIEGTWETVLAIQKIVGGAYGNPGLRMAEFGNGSPSIVVTNGGATRVEFNYNGGSYRYELLAGTIVDQDGATVCNNVDSLNFSSDAAKPGTIRVDITTRRAGGLGTATLVRYVSWVSLRNR